MKVMAATNKEEYATSPSKALQGLPPKFVSALRTLFDVMDDKKTGFIHLSDIESRWNHDEDGVGLPAGVVDSLRKVTPPSGELSFERFCAGLKICLLRNKAEKARSQDSSSDTQNFSDPDDQSIRVTKLRQQRIVCNLSPALSLPPKLDPPVQVTTAGPPKPPRHSFPAHDRRLGDGGAASDGELDQKSKQSQFLFQKQEKEKGKGLGGDQEPSRKQTRRRESHSRRHTLQNGIDYGLLKRMKSIEEERDALLKGLQTVERAEQWYKEQLSSVQERMRNVARTGGTRPDTEITKEKLVFQIARIDEVNQLINSLITADISFPLGMNLALGDRTSFNLSSTNSKDLERQILRLKDQNKLLTEEVSKKSNAITVLDQEKGALIRELFQARSRARQDKADYNPEGTFM